MTTTPNLLLTHIVASQSQKEVTANAALDGLDEKRTDSYPEASSLDVPADPRDEGCDEEHSAEKKEDIAISLEVENETCLQLLLRATEAFGSEEEA